MRTKNLSITLKLDVIEKIKSYQEENFLPSFSATISMLAMKQLKKEVKK